ncbi:hypothetical protein B0H13DRAFT_2416212 [Mycena leptocephala]|nr:hypothetical protein B0H13DRAFT_2416212 [Mycena leptocephala]
MEVVGSLWWFQIVQHLFSTGILRRVGRKEEAIQLLRSGVAFGTEKYWASSSKLFNQHFYFLLVELAATWGHVGQPEKALMHAEQAAAACQEDVDESKLDEQNCTLIHSLTTFSNCLAAVGRNDEALAISHEAVSIYTQNEGQMWDDFVIPIRKQELGANAFHSLSLQLMAAGELNEAIVKPRKPPNCIASCLQNLASILWNVGCPEEAITACEEAIGIMRKVVEMETYFLPALADALDQLAGYLTEKKSGGHTILTSRPDFLFEKIGMESDNEDNEEEEGAWETASEGDDEYYDVPMDTDVVISDATHSENPVSASIDNTPTSSFAVLEEPEGPATTDTALVAKGSLTEILSKPLEVRLNMSMNMRGTPMDILWWTLVGILLVAVWSRIV